MVVESLVNLFVVMGRSGAPTNLAGTAGQYYFRSDTPTVALQRIYVCAVSGSAGSATWVGIV